MGSLLANSVATLLARIAVPVFSFAISVTIARLYGAETLGIYVQLMALAVIFQTMATAGIPLLLTRDIAADPEATDAHLRRARSFAMMSGLAVTLAFLAYAVLILRDGQRWAAMVLAVTMLPSAGLAIQEGFFMATRTHHRMTVVAVVENSLKLAFAMVAFVLGKGIVAICAAIAAARLVAFETGQRLMARSGKRLKWGFSLGDALSFSRLVAPFAVLLSVSMIYFRIDILLVGFLRDTIETGLYGAAITLYTIALLLLSSVMSAVYPRLSATFRDSREGFVEATLLAVKLLALGVVPLAVVLMCLSELALVTVFGEPYSGAAPVLRLLAASVPLHAINGALGQGLQAGQQQAAMVKIVTVGLAAHVIGVLILVPMVGVEGAAVSVFISSTMVTMGSFLAFHRHLSLIRPGWRGLAVVTALIAPIAIMILAPPERLFQVGAAALVVFAIMIVAGAISRPEFDRLLRVVIPSRTTGGP